MSAALMLLGAGVLLIAGLQLSAFFSGSEIGFYRVSPLKLSIDANSGDEVARKLYWFVRNPSYFVATILVGNNVANYVTTLAIGLTVSTLFPGSGAAVEVLSAVVFSPVVFVLGELVPKQRFLIAPQRLLRSRAQWLQIAYRGFYVVSLPLVWLTRVLERIAGGSGRPGELLLGRQRLIHVLSRGRDAGVLTHVQGQLVHGLLSSAEEAVVSSMTPNDRVFGINVTQSIDEALAWARKFGLTEIVVRERDDEDWFGYVRVIDLHVRKGALRELVHELPRLSERSTKLEALTELRVKRRTIGAICRDDRVVGIVRERGLTEQLFRGDRATNVGVKLETSGTNA